MRRTSLLIFATLWTVCLAPLASALPTEVLVRVYSRDAKVIGDGVGGVRITIKNVATGEVLAEGIQKGSSGDTGKIMLEPHERNATVYGTEGAAGYKATLDLARPTEVEIIAEGPLDNPQATRRASKTLLLVPGRHVLGEGVLLEIHGFIVALEQPPAAASLTAGQEVPIRVRTTMTCGCPIEPGGLWDANKIEVVARWLDGDAVVTEVPLTYGGETNIFTGQLTAPAEAGQGTLQILAIDSANANFGIAEAPFEVKPKG